MLLHHRVDVATEFRDLIADAERETGKQMAVSLDKSGRNVEIMYKVDSGDTLVYLALTSPTNTFQLELDQLKRLRWR